MTPDAARSPASLPGSSVDEAVALFERERVAIWLSPPDEILRLGAGTSPRGIGSRGQYLTPIMFAEGAARSFADEVLWTLVQLCDDPDLDLATLKAYAAALSRKKAGFFAFVGLDHLSDMTGRYVDAALAAENAGELRRLTVAFLPYVNRAHVWIDAAFPWGLCSGFRRPAQPVEAGSAPCSSG